MHDARHCHPLQFGAQICPTQLMEELTNEVTDLVIEQATSATVAMNLLVNLQESVKIMDSGLEMHQLVKVSLLASL